ncbi:heme oxygenase, HugZ family [Campylobacter sp. RM16704]|uniref:heme oxygenase, HugZ family n=1 Tax=Campylobacter sp. RM16704 TaxID=1500960 RepID=UPI00058211DC|nr:heme oxygenase, HugZ family [Campylobacter sp. RM16704]AJC85970.1 heme oxygenase, HugZ family [Campylobacter sp. RM16704]
MQLHNEINDFIQSCKSIILSTINLKKQVICSYAPIIKIKDSFYIYISEIAEHFEGVKYNSENIEIMFIEDEQNTFSILARKRLKFKVKTLEIERNNENFDYILEYYKKQNPQEEEIIKTIKNMQDFHLFKLVLKNGRYVKGFGKAYDINKEEIKLVDTKGHK